MRHVTKRVLAHFSGELAFIVPEMQMACGADVDSDTEYLGLSEIELHSEITERNRPTCAICCVKLDVALEKNNGH